MRSTSAAVSLIINIAACFCLHIHYLFSRAGLQRFLYQISLQLRIPNITAVLWIQSTPYWNLQWYLRLFFCFFSDILLLRQYTVVVWSSRSDSSAIVMTKALVKASAKASSLKPEIRLAQALSEFEASLTQEQKTTFRMLKSQSVSTAPTPSDVMRLTAEVDRRMSKKFSGQCFGPRFTNFLQGVQQFAALGDVVVGGSQSLIACGVWTLVRMSLLVGILLHHSCNQLLTECSRL
jgi:hypothetical protein